MIPVLFITYNRLEFTKYALFALCQCYNCKPIVIDNGSTDGTAEWLRENFPQPILNITNLGIAGAMNQFLKMTRGDMYVGKVDNDTIVPRDFITKMLPHMRYADIVQAKHPILKATHPGGFDAWVERMPKAGALRYNHFVGGSGVLFKRSIVDHIPETEWMLYGWRAWQAEHPEIKKAFATDVSIQLLDTNESGAAYPAQYKDYYKTTKRL